MTHSRRMEDPEAFRRFFLRLTAQGWKPSSMDGDGTLTCDVGDVALTIWPNATPIQWSTVVISLDNLVGRGQFVERGEAPTLQEAKDACKDGFRLRNLVRKAFAHILGEGETP